MKAAVLRGPGEIPEYADFDDPQAPEGYELVEIVAAGIHPVVRSLATGRHYGSTGTWPLIPGVDAVAGRPGAHSFTPVWSGPRTGPWPNGPRFPLRCSYPFLRRRRRSGSPQG
jgi:hypothetical protein